MDFAQMLLLLTLLDAALLVGNEFAIGTVVHPSLKSLGDEAHVLGVQKIGARLGAAMPFWMASVVILCASLLFVAPLFSTVWNLFFAATVCFAAAIFYSLLGNVPINNRVVKWNVSDLPDDWRALRNRWDKLHNFRITILLAGLTCLFAALVINF